MIEVKALVQPKIGFASHQNAVPLIADLKIENGGEEAVGPAILTLSASPTFISPRTWRIERLAPGATTHISDRLVSLDAGMLAGLNEALRGTLCFTLTAGEAQLAEARYEVECLPRLHWAGMGALGLLAAYCMPNDPAIDRILKSASEILHSTGKQDAIDGYRRSAQDAWQLVSAIWTAIRRLNLSYALPPASFEVEGQKVRSPSAILDGLVATCLDTSLLFAACLEQGGLHPLIILTQGHAFCGFWTRATSLPDLAVEEAEVLRKHVALNDLVVFETTFATDRNDASFLQAIAQGNRQLEEAHDAAFEAALDIRRARMMRVRPLGSEAVIARAVPEIEAAPFHLDLPPEDFIAIPADDEPQPADTPEGRLAHWQRKLLDLTTRNRLLHVGEKNKVGS